MSYDGFYAMARYADKDPKLGTGGRNVQPDSLPALWLAGRYKPISMNSNR